MRLSCLHSVKHRRKQTVKCCLCGHFGHNRKTRKEPINASQAESTSNGIYGESLVGGTRCKFMVSRGYTHTDAPW